MKDKNIDVGTTYEFLIWLKNQPNNLYTDQYCVVVKGQQSWMIYPVEIVTLSCDGMKKFIVLLLPFKRF